MKKISVETGSSLIKAEKVLKDSYKDLGLCYPEFRWLSKIKRRKGLKRRVRVNAGIRVMLNRFELWKIREALSGTLDPCYGSGMVIRCSSRNEGKTLVNEIRKRLENLEITIPVDPAILQDLEDARKLIRGRNDHGVVVWKEEAK